MKNRVSEILNTKYPLIQAPMSWNTDAQLVAAVANAGGLGILGPNAGQKTLTSDPKETAERMRNEIRKTRELTSSSFGLNIISSGEERDKDNPFYNELLRVAFEENIKYFAIVGEANKVLFDKIKEHNGVIIYRPITPTPEIMKVAEKMGADLLVATGYDEGGGLPVKSVGTFTVVPTMVDSVNIPVLAAGGINDSRGVKAAFALGAEGVYIGTRFIATQEAPSAIETKQAILDSGHEDMAFIVKTLRSILTKKAEIILKKHENNEDTSSDITGGFRTGMLEGKFDEGIISVNNGIDIIKDIPTVEELIERFFEK
ncbi:NAD(P)H-dependent flavin oxidoreductase [Priestia megaterium]|uniref:NAD(P)H-dependent flavin oxidoreductase n=1 Tax=Priestia megaterium TaxID=1404 RepID=UPI00101DA4C1|nr:nitronate monooxygenase [Priestia megaterium]